MQTPNHSDAIMAHGIQFAVLAQAFPVLRHDALKPIANAKLAAGMMQRTAGETPLDMSDERTQQLLNDVDVMLDEGVDTVRLLGEWLTDTGKRVAMATLVRECTKLVFTHLLLYGKRITLAESVAGPDVALFGGRYVMLAMLLHLVDVMPDGSELLIEGRPDGQVQASIHPGKGSTLVRASDGRGGAMISWPAVETLASFYGWRAELADGVFTMALPSATQRKAA
jgi:aryl carrier-like protein